jgi:hypothetical protein
MHWGGMPMHQATVQRIELDLTLEQILSIVRQLGPQEQEAVRKALETRPWSQRLDALLARVWERVASYPISEEEINEEVERVRTAR